MSLITDQQSLDPSAIISLYQVDINIPPCTFIGSITGTVLTVTTIVQGVLSTGLNITGTGILADTNIISFGTGTGGVGTYNIDRTQTVGSISMSGSTILYFSNQKNEKLGDIVWQGITYVSIPIEAKGFETRGNGQFPRPTLKISNYAGVLSGLAKQYDDLINVKFTRKRTRAKYLDAINFTAGNPTADPNTYYPDDIFYINRKTNETRYFVEWELVSALDISGIKLPRRQVIQNTCTWKYRSAECTYTGNTTFWNTNDVVVNTLAEDICGKRLSSCKLRFPGNASILPYGGFPGCAMI